MRPARQFLGWVRKHWWKILLPAVVGALIVGVREAREPDHYEATLTLAPIAGIATQIGPYATDLGAVTQVVRSDEVEETVRAQTGGVSRALISLNAEGAFWTSDVTVTVLAESSQVAREVADSVAVLAIDQRRFDLVRLAEDERTRIDEQLEALDKLIDELRADRSAAPASGAEQQAIDNAIDDAVSATTSLEALHAETSARIDVVQVDIEVTRMVVGEAKPDSEIARDIGLTFVLVGVAATSALCALTLRRRKLERPSSVLADTGSVPLEVWFLAAYAASLPNETIIAVIPGTSLPLLVGVATIAVWLWRGDRFTPGDQSVPVIVLMLSFFAWHALSTIWTIDINGSANANRSLLMALAMTVLTLAIVRTTGELALVLTGFVVGTLISFIDVYVRLIRDPGLLDNSRIAAWGFDQNEYAGVLIIGVCAAAIVLALSPTPIARRLSLALLVLVVIPLIATGSRAAFIAFVPAYAGLVALAWGRLDRRRFLLLVGAPSVAVALGALVFLGGEGLDRFGSLFTTSIAGDSSVSTRSKLFDVSLDATVTHPIRGVGAGSFGDLMVVAHGIRSVAHNSFASIAAELGLVGLALFVGLLLLAVRQLQMAQGAVRIQAGVLVLAVVIMSLTINWQTSKHFWFAMAASLAVAQLDSSREATP